MKYIKYINWKFKFSFYEKDGFGYTGQLSVKEFINRDESLPTGDALVTSDGEK